MTTRQACLELGWCSSRRWALMELSGCPQTPLLSHRAVLLGRRSRPHTQEGALSQWCIPIPFVSNWVRHVHMIQFWPMGSDFIFDG